MRNIYDQDTSTVDIFLRYAILPINSIVEFAVLVDGEWRAQQNFQNSGILNVRFRMFAPFW